MENEDDDDDEEGFDDFHDDTFLSIDDLAVLLLLLFDEDDVEGADENDGYSRGRSYLIFRNIFFRVVVCVIRVCMYVYMYMCGRLYLVFRVVMCVCVYYIYLVTISGLSLIFFVYSSGVF